MEDPTGVNVAGVTDWFAAHVPEAVAPFDFDLVAGGRSNLTFSVTDANARKWVLRRPPTSHVLASAHDMAREHRLIAALGPTKVPVPVAIGLCADESVNDAPFYVMEFVEGTIVRDAATAEKLFTREQRRHMGEDIIDTLVAIHAVNLEEVGLDDLARHEGYIERQLKRWHTQFQASAAQNERSVPVIDEMHDFLQARIPEQGPAAIVHGDYRLDNCMIGADGSVAAVLDWELCTLGDPLADVGLLMVYWNEASDTSAALPTSATQVDGFPNRAELKARYAAATGRDVAELDFFVSFGYWKLACILEGVFARYAHGAMGNDGAAFDGFGQQVVFLGEQARAAAAGL
ncbi:MAG TPA: phosphotransferase family protein [Acidimicrobiales bacterium]|nr:phosphotransferase family protein [Acidimicrobiales bacterium]